MDLSITAEKLRTLRAMVAQTQQEVADALGISRSALNAYELGQRTPRDEVKLRIANYYGVSVESIFFN